MLARFLRLAFALTVAASTTAVADRGVINDPDGFTNLRAAPTRESALVGKARNGQIVDFDSAGGSGWWKVTLASGKKGYMHSSRIRLHATMADLADAPANDEIHIFARQQGVNFFAVARAAAKADEAAMKRFFEFQSDGGAFETHDAAFIAVTHLLGDERLSTFLKSQPAATKTNVRERFEGSNGLSIEAQPYLQRHFPQTAALLFR